MFDTGPLWIRLGQRLLPECAWSGDSTQPRIALTYDDGPDPDRTPRLLDILDRLNISVTFFWLGDRLIKNPSIVARVAESPHAIGLHGQHHHSFFLSSPRSLVLQFQAQQKQIAQLTGRDPATLNWVRPPWGHATPKHIRALHEQGFQVAMASLLPGDWSASPHVVVQRVLAQVRNGSLIALHDGRPAGRNCLAIANQLLPALIDRGFELVTVPELLSAN